MKPKRAGDLMLLRRNSQWIRLGEKNEHFVNQKLWVGSRCPFACLIKLETLLKPPSSIALTSVGGAPRGRGQSTHVDSCRFLCSYSCSYHVFYRTRLPVRRLALIRESARPLVWPCTTKLVSSSKDLNERKRGLTSTRAFCGFPNMNS